MVKDGAPGAPRRYLSKAPTLVYQPHQGVRKHALEWPQPIGAPGTDLCAAIGTRDNPRALPVDATRVQEERQDKPHALPVGAPRDQEKEVQERKDLRQPPTMGALACSP